MLLKKQPTRQLTYISNRFLLANEAPWFAAAAAAAGTLLSSQMLIGL
jgi:hypothetical protein